MNRDSRLNKWYIPNIIDDNYRATPLRDIVIANRPLLSSPHNNVTIQWSAIIAMIAAEAAAVAHIETHEEVATEELAAQIAIEAKAEYESTPDVVIEQPTQDEDAFQEGEEDEDSEQIIDKFLSVTSLRIVADDGADDSQIENTSEYLELDSEMISEELAQIYFSQGLNSRAIEIYTQLSLLNSEKSSYFALLIEEIKQNN